MSNRARWFVAGLILLVSFSLMIGGFLLPVKYSEYRMYVSLSGGILLTFTDLIFG